MENFISELRAARAQEHCSITSMLVYLRELEKQKFYLRLGYSSVFAFCVAELNYSEPEAQLRIQAMRLMRAVPEAKAWFEQGSMSLTVAGLVQSAARREKLPSSSLKDLARNLKGCSKREAEKILAAKFPRAARPEMIKPISAELVEVRFTLNHEELEMVDSVLDQKAHTNFDRSVKKLFLDSVSKQIPKEYQQEDASPQRPAEGKGRHIPLAVRRFVMARDKSRCQFKDEVTGKFCHCRHGVQIDHIVPFSEGGTHAPENLRLLCGAHNRFRNETPRANKTNTATNKPNLHTEQNAAT